MPAPYLTKNLWPDFTLAETTYSFAHLAEQYLTVVDSAGQERRIIATFTDHVFTRDRLTSDVIEHAFPGCSRGVGFVCSERHALSLQLPTLLPNICSSKVWNLTGADRYAQVPVVMKTRKPSTPSFSRWTRSGQRISAERRHQTRSER